MAQEGAKSSKVVHLRVSHREAGRCANTCRVQTFYSVTNQRSYGNARIRFTVYHSSSSWIRQASTKRI